MQEHHLKSLHPDYWVYCLNNIMNAPAPRATIGRYRLEAKLGEGGMGEVYRALDLQLGRAVAIKLLPIRFVTEPDRLERFDREARAASALNHPNIATVYEAGVEEGIPYIAMELVEGRRLRDLLKGVPLPAAQLIDIGTQTAAGLAKAHSGGVVHRDLKPENLMISADGYVKILDFGLAKLVQPPEADGDQTTQTMTQAGVILGTTPYMSPEQASGDDVDFRSDQFSLGTVLYEMSSGKNPFREASAVHTMSAVVSRVPEPLDARNSTAFPELAAIIHRCLQKNRGDRYASTSELARALKALHAARTSEVLRAEPIRRRPAVLKFAWIIAASLITAAALASWVSWTRTAAAAAENRRMVAVMPFKSISLDPSREYVVAGVTEEVRDRLSKVAALRVISAGAVSRYRAGETKRLGAETGAGSVVEGSVRLEGSRVRVSVALVDTRTEQTLWADQFDRKAEDLFAVQTEIATSVAGALKARLTSGEQIIAQKRPTENLGAYDLYLRASHFPPFTSGNDAAIEMLQRAITLDPNFADAMSALSNRLAYRAVYRNIGLSEDCVEWAQKAIALDPGSSKAYHALANAYALLGRLAIARETFLRALEVDPNHTPSMNDLSNVDDDLGRFEEALRWSSKALLLSPNIPNAYYHVSMVLFFYGDHPTSTAFLALSRKRFPIKFVRDSEILALLEQGRGAEAMASARQLLQRNPQTTRAKIIAAETAYLAHDPDAERFTASLFESSPGPRFENWGLVTESARTRYACLLMERGDRSRALRILSDAEREIRRLLEGGIDTPFAYEELAAIKALQGDKQAALDAYARAYDRGWRFNMLTELNPAFNSLRGTAEFQSLVAKMKADVARMRDQSSELRQMREKTIPYLESLPMPSAQPPG